jgi:hypothetical protein
MTVWCVFHEARYRYGGAPTYWSATGTVDEVKAAVLAYLDRPIRSSNITFDSTIRRLTRHLSSLGRSANPFLSRFQNSTSLTYSAIRFLKLPLFRRNLSRPRRFVSNLNTYYQRAFTNTPFSLFFQLLYRRIMRRRKQLVERTGIEGRNAWYPRQPLVHGICLGRGQVHLAENLHQHLLEELVLVGI